MKQPNTRDAYDAWHQALNVDARASEPWYKLLCSHLDMPRDVAGKRILEIGCGRGGFACWLATQVSKPNEVVALDLSAVAVEKGRDLARRTGVFNITFGVGDIQDLSYPRDSFDTVISCETIEHVPHPRRAVQSLGRVLKPGGRLFLSTPNYLSTFGLYRAYLRIRGRRFTEIGQPINNFTTVFGNIKWIREAGLRVERVDAVGHYVFWPGRSPRRVGGLDRWARPVLRWFGVHSLVVAEKSR